MKEIYPFGDWLQEQIKAAGITQMELALRLDMTQGQINRYIKGHATPEFRNIIRIVDLFGKKLVVAEKDQQPEDQPDE